MENLDDLDIATIRALQEDARTSNREIAARNGVTEVTIASRIRSLEQRHILRVVMQRDLIAMGYNILAELAVYLNGRPTEAVANDLTAIDEVLSVGVLMGNPDLHLQLLANNFDHLLQLIESRISPIKGIVTIETNIVLEVVKLDPRYGSWSVR